ncbi:MAG: ATP-binding protein [Nostoc sp.]|uniref:ATP-binding protein n=1 Tax=Nostoc sp. JL33 TaxID=2815396 RepID=UPI0025FE9039|nr:ATP-binding protein [Nostoc sp. JL33]
MNEEVKQKLFDHLFTTKAVGKGTGLGLAIARQIVEETHCGKLSFSLFWVRVQNSSLKSWCKFLLLEVIYKGLSAYCDPQANTTMKSEYRELVNEVLRKIGRKNKHR